MNGEARARLDQLREQLDAIDDELLSLVARRAAVVDEVAALKRREGAPLHDPERERALTARLVARRPGRLGEAAVARLVEAVLRACSPGSTTEGPGH